MYWIFGVKFLNLGDSCVVGGDPTMNIIIARVPVLNAPEHNPCVQKERAVAVDAYALHIGYLL